MRSAKTGLILLCVAWVFTAQAATITKLSVADGTEADNASINPSISSDGRFVAFESDATNLVADDTNNATDVFVADVQNGSIERISLGLSGVEANGASTNPVISGNGRYVAFESFASNLVSGDTNRVIDIFVYDRQTGSTSLVSVNSNGSLTTSHSFSPSISGNGQVIAFYSLATNLVDNDTNRAIDVFIHDTLSGSTERISVDSSGNQANMASWQPRISTNGQFVVFSSTASNLVVGDTNSAQDIFLYNRQDSSVMLISNADDGQPSNGISAYAAVSGDGNVVVFESDATNLVANDNNAATDIFVFDKRQGSLSRVSRSVSDSDTDGPSYQPTISHDGRFVSFYTYASNLVAGDSNQFEDVFVYDRQTGYMELLTNTMERQEANSSSFNPTLNADGRYVALFSFASNLSTPDTNNVDDVFLFDRGVINTPPIANAGNDSNVVLGTSVVLDGSGSFDPDGDPIALYQWQVVSTPANSNLGSWIANEVNPLFAPDSSGVFVLSLTVSDGLATSSADEIFINVSDNLPPVAVAVVDVTQGYVPLNVSFDGSQSYDPESGAISYLWNFGDGTSSQEVSPFHLYTAPGSYLTTLTVIDDVGNQSQTELRIEVLAANQPPVITNLSVSPASGPAPLLANFSLQVSDPENDSLSVVWNLGDGTNVYDELQFSHAYIYPGTYKGSVTVSDGISSTQQKFTISVDSDFVINDTYYKIYVPHEQPERGKFRFAVRFEFNEALTADDIVALEFGGLKVFELPFGEFRQASSGTYVYKSRRLMVALDFNEQIISVHKQRFFIDKDSFKPFAGIVLQFGLQTATTAINLSENRICYRKRHYQQDEEYCPVSIWENTHVITNKDD
jgi:PKD repeat protein